MVEKIKLYLGEYITEEALERLNMAFKSLGERLGFVSAGDARRARERKIREDAEKRGRELERQKSNETIAKLQAEIASLKSALASKT